MGPSLVLCREAPHLQRWQRIHTFYFELEGSDRERDESSRNQKAKYISFIPVECWVQFT